MTGRPGKERGAATIEVALLVPVIIVLLVFTIAGARLVDTRGAIDGAARDAARAASGEGWSDAARAAAEDSVGANLDQRGRTCAPRRVAVDVSRFAPGGTVAVEVTCGVGLDDLAFPGLPGTKILTSRFVAPIDPLGMRP
jgi:Flp pilus assembly protein TadG